MAGTSLKLGAVHPVPFTNMLEAFFALPLLVAASVALAEDKVELAPAAQPPVVKTPDFTGSTAFCLYELPNSDPNKRRWLNLGIVQYVEYKGNELKIYYGGGNLGSGHEAVIPVADAAQLDSVLDRIRAAASSCR